MSVFHYLVILALGGLLGLLLEAFKPALAKRQMSNVASGLLLVFILRAMTGQMSVADAALPGFATPWLNFDGLAMAYLGLFLVTGLVVVQLLRCSESHLGRFTLDHGLTEFYALVPVVVAAMGLMAAARDLVTVFVALELVTVSFYVLVAMARRNAGCLEGGVKYLILGALSTGVLVYGMAWMYGACSTLSFDGIAAAMKSAGTAKPAALLASALLLAALGFKISAAPFHSWVPDVYQGAPLAVTAFLSVASKAAGFVVLSRLAVALMAEGSVVAGEVRVILLAMGSLTVLLGSLPALHQFSVKRLLGFSSISHAGFMLLGLAASGADKGAGFIVFYLATYLPMTLLAFAILTVMQAHGLGDQVSDFRGLAKRSPLLAGASVLCFASLAGLPLSIGFWGKWLVLLSLSSGAHQALLIMAIVGAAAGFYYYFRPILACFVQEDGGRQAGGLNLSIERSTLLVLLCASTLLLGLFPRPINGLLKLQVGTSAKAQH